MSRSVLTHWPPTLIGGQRSEAMVPMTLEEVLAEGAWMDRMDPNGQRFTFKAHEFASFIEAPEPRGLGTSKEAIRKFLGDSNNPLRVEFERLAEGKPGNPIGRPQDARREETGRFAVIRPDDDGAPSIPNIVRDTGDSPEPPPINLRDRSREPQAGNSIGYAVRRLEREAAKDPEGPVAAIYDRLKAGEITANAAAVLAGHRSRLITIPPSPLRAGRLLARHFTPGQFEELVRAYRVAVDAGVSPAEEGGDR